MNGLIKSSSTSQFAFSNLHDYDVNAVLRLEQALIAHPTLGRMGKADRITSCFMTS